MTVSTASRDTHAPEEVGATADGERYNEGVSAMDKNPSPEPDSDPTLHVFAQPAPHADAWIVGNRNALIRLREALTAILDRNSMAAAVKVSVNDGEWFSLMVVMTGDGDAEGSMGSVQRPYTDEPFVDTGETTRPPYRLLTEEAYRALSEWTEAAVICIRKDPPPLPGAPSA